MRATHPTIRSFRRHATVAGLVAALSLLASCAQDAANHVDAGDVRQAAADEAAGNERGAAMPADTGLDRGIDGTGQAGQAADADAGAIMVATSGGPGPYLVNSAGSALYYLEGDTDGSRCIDACAEAWPPALVAGVAPSTGADLDASLLGTIDRADGSSQVTYGGHPLYRYAGDVGAGRTNGMDVTDKYGQWHLAGPDGEPVAGDARGSGARSTPREGAGEAMGR